MCGMGVGTNGWDVIPDTPLVILIWDRAISIRGTELNSVSLESTPSILDPVDVYSYRFDPKKDIILAAES